MVEVKPLLTPDEVACMYDRGEIDSEVDFELVDGEIIYLTKPSDPDHARICVRIAAFLFPFAEEIGAWLMSESYLYRVAPQGRNLRAPDIALTTKERRHIFPVPKGWATEAPDLCVEVLSPGQYGEAYAKPKVAEYLSAGAKVVWLVNPENQSVRVYDAGREEYSIYPADADMTLDQIAPGFRVRVSSFFPEQASPHS